MLARIPLILPVDKLRDKILQLCDIGQFTSINSVMNMLKVLSIPSEADPNIRKQIELSMNNFVYLINKMHKLKSAIFIEDIKNSILCFNDNELTQIIIRLMRILPTDDIFHTILSILSQCLIQLKYSLLLNLMKSHSIIKILIGYLKFSQVNCNVVILLQFFLLGYQISPTIFHDCIPDLEKVLVKIIKAPLGSSQFPKKFVELLILLIKAFPRYLEQYTKLIELIKEVISKYNIDLMPDEKIDGIIQNTNWFSITKKLSGAIPIANYQIFIPPTNAFGYKGLANLGNSKVI